MTCIDQAVLRLNRHLGFNIRNPGLEGSTTRFVSAKAHTILGNAERSATAPLFLSL